MMEAVEYLNIWLIKKSLLFSLKETFLLHKMWKIVRI